MRVHPVHTMIAIWKTRDLQFSYTLFNLICAHLLYLLKTEETSCCLFGLWESFQKVNASMHFHSMDHGSRLSIQVDVNV